MTCFCASKEYPSCTGAPSHISLIQNIDHKVASWRPFSESANIREIALHIAHWENSLNNRLTNSKKSLGLSQRKCSWIKRTNPIDADIWKSEIELIKRVRANTAETLKLFNPKKLDECAPKTKQTYAVYIHGIAMHSIYHTNRIKFIKELYMQNG